MSYLIGISRLSEQNIGGLVEIKVARNQDVVSIPESVDGTVYGDIVFEAGKGFQTWYATSQSMRMVSNNKNSQEGNYKNNRLPFIISKDRATLKPLFEQAETDEFIVLYKDGNGNQKLFGDKYHPVKFTFNQDSSDTHSGRNAFTCQFYYEGPDNISFYDGTISAAPSGAAPVVIQYNGVTKTTANAGDVVNIVGKFKIDDFLININVT